MMMSKAGKKGSMVFCRLARSGYSDSTAAIVNCALRSDPLWIASTGMGFMGAHASAA
jgi:hypothetical protein